LLFVGLKALLAALPRGGQLPEDYPLKLRNYMDGLLADHWKDYKPKSSKFTHIDKVKEFVSLISHMFCFFLDFTIFLLDFLPG
jgi:hypothetical protein